MGPKSARADAGSYPAGRANFALGIFLAAYVLSFVDRQILSLMVDPIRRDLGISDVQIGLLQGLAFALLYAFLGVPIGLLADRLVRKRIIAAGILFWSVATGLCGLATSYIPLFLARMGVGLGEAALSPTAHSFLSDAFPPARLARAMAIYTLGITIGAGGAFMIGGTVVEIIARGGAVDLPLLGRLSPWQTAFLAVALPGFLLAPLTLLVTEPARRRGSADPPSAQRFPLAPALHHVGANWRVFVPIYLTSSLLGILGYSLTSWYPTHLIRTFGITAGQAGHYIGLIYLVLGSAGSIAGGLLAERLALKGRADANLRVVALVCATVAPPAIAAPLMTNLPAMLVLFALATFLFYGFFGASTAAIQLTTPDHMRATNAALFLLANNLIGLGLGAAAAPVVNTFLFGGTNQLGPALALIAATVCPLALALSASGLKPYAALVQRMADIEQGNQ